MKRSIYRRLAVAAGLAVTFALPAHAVPVTFSDAGAQGQPHPEIIGAGLMLLAIALGLSAIGIARVLPRLGLATGASLIVSSLAIGGTAIFHDYNRTIDQDRNLEGFIHNACASVAILGIVVATVLTMILLPTTVCITEDSLAWAGRKLEWVPRLAGRAGVARGKFPRE